MWSIQNIVIIHKSSIYKILLLEAEPPFGSKQNIKNKTLLKP